MDDFDRPVWKFRVGDPTLNTNPEFDTNWLIWLLRMAWGRQGIYLPQDILLLILDNRGWMLYELEDNTVMDGCMTVYSLKMEPIGDIQDKKIRIKWGKQSGKKEFENKFMKSFIKLSKSKRK
jgi:hypothetical protein